MKKRSTHVESTSVLEDADIAAVYGFEELPYALRDGDNVAGVPDQERGRAGCRR